MGGAILGMRCQRQFPTVTVELVRSSNDSLDGGSAETLPLPPSIDGDMPQLAVVNPVSDRQHPDSSTALVAHEERLPPTSSRLDVTLRQDHEGDRLVIGHERTLVIAHAYFERLSPIAAIDQLEPYRHDRQYVWNDDLIAPPTPSRIVH